MDHFNHRHRVGFGQHLLVIEPQHLQPLPRQRLVSQGIRALMLRLQVLTAVQLDDQRRLCAVEVKDVVQQRLLTVELNAVDLFSSQALPELLFRIGQLEP